MMSEKRFTLTDWHEVKDNGNIMTVDEVVGKLNEQQATINELKERNAHDFAKKMQLIKENEQLRQENRMLKKDLNKLYNLLMDKGMSHNELQDVLWRIDDE